MRQGRLPVGFFSNRNAAPADTFFALSGIAADDFGEASHCALQSRFARGHWAMFLTIISCRIIWPLEAVQWREPTGMNVAVSPGTWGCRGCCGWNTDNERVVGNPAKHLAPACQQTFPVLFVI